MTHLRWSCRTAVATHVDKVHVVPRCHFILMQKNRMELIREVQLFLDDSFTREK